MSKRASIYLKYKYFVKLYVNVFTATFDTFNVSLLNKVILTSNHSNTLLFLVFIQFYLKINAMVH